MTDEDEDETFYIKQSDDVPVIQTTLVDANNNAVDLSNATVNFHMAEPRGGSTVVDAPATVTDAANGKVEYKFDGDGTAYGGRYRAEFEVTFGDGDVETFPNVGYETVFISEQLA